MFYESNKSSEVNWKRFLKHPMWLSHAVLEFGKAFYEETLFAEGASDALRESRAMLHFVYHKTRNPRKTMKSKRTFGQFALSRMEMAKQLCRLASLLLTLLIATRISRVN